MDTTDRDQLLRLLDWYRSAGVTAVVGETPVNWLARGDKPIATVERRGGATAPAAHPTSTRVPPPANQSLQPPPTRPAEPPRNARSHSRAQTTPPADAERDARERATNAHDLAALRAALADFEGCPLKVTAKNLCFFRGAERADLMVIGEGPGRDEDRTGTPFVGRAGQLLDRMLAAIGRSEADTHITNVVYWRPPGNRTPTPAEVLACRPFLERQIELVDPAVVLAVGGAAAKTLLDTQQGIMKTRGKWNDCELGGRKRPLLATFHPAYLLRTPAAKRNAWKDLLALQSRLEDLRPSD